MSDERLTAVQALCRVMADVHAVRKGDRNTEQGYSFRGIDAVVNAVGPALREHRVIPVPHKVDVSYRDVRTSRDKPARECTVKVTYRFYGPAGDFVEAETPGESMDSGDKGTPKAMSVAYRTCLLQALCIPTDEPDPDGDTYERSSEESQPDPVSALRGHIWRAAKAVGLQSREAIEVDCRETTGWDITQADQGQLESYLAGLKARADKPPDDKWYVRSEAEIAKPQTDDPLKSLKLQIWTAAKQAGLDTKEHLEQDFAQSTGGLILGEASEDELRSYLGLLKSRLENPQNDGPGASIDEGEPL